MKGFTQLDVSRLFSKHKARIEEALSAFHRRDFFAAYPEMPNDPAYPADGEKAARERFAALIGKRFDDLHQKGDTQVVSAESSPYTLEELKIGYTAFKDPKEYVEAAEHGARLLWINSSVESRVGVLAEALERIKGAFFDIAVATQHTTGQPFMMSFQASGPHAADRALEALALSYQEQTRFPKKVRWEKPMGKTTAVIEKHFRPMPRGVALAIACSTFPVWNSLPGIFASLAAGNAVIVKPHPGSILPLAICVAKIQEALKQEGYEAEVCLLAPDLPDAPIAKILCEHKDVKIIDFTGGNEFGNYVESLPGKVTFTEKAGANSIVIDSTTDLKLMMQNIAFSLCLYSGQMCTAPQNIFISERGVLVGDRLASYDEVVQALVDAVKGLSTHPKAGPAICGAIQSPQTLERAMSAGKLGGKVLLEAAAYAHPEFPNARTCTPAIVELSSMRSDLFYKECFGPVAFVVKTDSLEHSMALAKIAVEKTGALSASVYCTNEDKSELIMDSFADVHTVSAFNLLGQVFMNQNAAFSDFHATGGNAAANASITDVPFVARRFTIVEAKVAV